MSTRAHEDGDQNLRILSPEDVQEARRAGTLFVALMKKVRAGMNPRDRAFYEMGLRAAHMEEAMATGEFERGEQHFKKLLLVASHILTTRMERALAEGDEERALAVFARLQHVQRRLL
jgi:hypothetical protein